MLLLAATTKPGNKYRSIKNPATYEALRRQGMSKQRAARISNAQSHKDAGVDAGAMAHGPGGLLSTPGLGASRKRKGKRWGMRTKDKQIVGNLYRSNTGKFVAGGQPSDAPPNFGHAAKKPKAGKRGAKQPKKIAQTPEQKRAARAAEHVQNQGKVLSGLNIAPDGQAALEALRSGAQPDPKALERGGFEQAGLVEQASDGSYRMTASGRALLTAAQSGDAGKAGAIISGARDRTSNRTQRQTEHAKRQQEVATRRAQREVVRRKKMTTKAASTPGDYLIVEDPKKFTTWHLQVKRNGTPDHGLMGSAWAALLGGGFRGNVYQGPNKTEAIAKLKKLYAAEKMDVPAEKAFIVYKDHTGAHRWLARTTTAYRDRDQEIISSDALDQDSQRMTATKTFGPLRYWHVGQPDPLNVATPWGPGLDIGDCDYSTLIGRTRVESGTFRDPKIALKIAQQSDQYELSPGFFHPLDQPDTGGVFHAIRTFERSIVPTAHGRASNLFTGLAVKEQKEGVRTKAQTDSEKAMFAKMGGGGSGGSGGSGGGSKLWPKGPSGKRTPQAAAAQARGSVATADRSIRRAGLLTEKGLQPDELQSLHWYQSAGHDRINAELRGSAPVRDQYTLDMTTGNIDRAMGRSKLRHAVEVHRGILPETPHARVELAKYQPGAVVRDPSYVSTTASAAVAKRFGSSQVDVRIHAPAGTPAIYMPTARPLSMVSRGAHNEHELLLGRNLQYRVLSRTEKNGKTQIELEVVP